MPTYQELRAQGEALLRQAEEVRKQEQAAVIAEIKQKMAEHGITLAQLGGREVDGVRHVGNGRKKRSDAGTPLPPKYKDNQGNTWSGRGITPKWLKAHLDAGKKVEDFAV
jgi:DNA-binding protein H-NS